MCVSYCVSYCMIPVSCGRIYILLLCPVVLLSSTRGFLCRARELRIGGHSISQCHRRKLRHIIYPPYKYFHVNITYFKRAPFIYLWAPFACASDAKAMASSVDKGVALPAVLLLQLTTRGTHASSHAFPSAHTHQQPRRRLVHLLTLLHLLLLLQHLLPSQTRAPAPAPRVPTTAETAGP